MIDNFALGLTHVLMMIVAVLLLRRPDLDDERAAREQRLGKPKGRPPRA